MRQAFLLSVLAVAAFAGCLGDDDDTTPSLIGDGLVSLPDASDRLSVASHPAYHYPSYTDYSGLFVDVPEAWIPPANISIPEVPTGMEHVANVGGITGAGIAIFGHYAFVSGNGPGSVIDIMDPMNPVKVAELNVSIRDADIIAHPDGRLTLVAASNGPINLWDVTDPTDPIQLEPLQVGSHNAVVVPGTPIVYNANSAGGQPVNIGQLEPALGASGVTEIFDLTDPENPVQLPDFTNGYGCHDITFFIDAENEKYRAYCAGIEVSQIWDIADPVNPVILSEIPVHHGVAGTPSLTVPLVLFSHLAMTNSDGTILIVGDETGGGAAPGCDAYADAGAATVSGPLGNLWFYDISDETDPQLLSFFSPTNTLTEAGPLPGGAEPIFNCTAHFGRLVQDKDMMVVGFYSAGVLLVDFTDPGHPFIADRHNEGAQVWDAWEWQGYVFTGDLSRGFDVFRLV